MTSTPCVVRVRGSAAKGGIHYLQLALSQRKLKGRWKMDMLASGRGNLPIVLQLTEIVCLKRSGYLLRADFSGRLGIYHRA